MIETIEDAVDAVAQLNSGGFGARPDYAEFIVACEQAVIDGRMVEKRELPTARREF